MTFDTDGNLYINDAGSGRVWRIDPDGEAESVAGGGSRFDAPVEPIGSADIALEFQRAHLGWDSEAGELVLLTSDTIFRIDVGGQTIRADLASVAFGDGLAVTGGSTYVSRLHGVISTVSGVARDDVWLPDPDATVTLGRPASVSSVGASAMLLQDPATRTIRLLVPDEGTFGLREERSPGAPPATPMAADSAGNIYYLISGGLIHHDVNDSARLLARRVPDRIFEGQSIEEVLLPMVGELTAGSDGSLWLLDSCYQVILNIDTVTGAVSHLAGSTRGGSRPRGDITSPIELFTLVAASGLAVDGDLLLLVDELPGGGTALYGINTSSGDQTRVGVELPSGQAGVLGGGGDAVYRPGAQFREIALERIVRAVPMGASLVVSIDDPSAPPLVLVDGTGAMSDLVLDSETTPSALAVIAGEEIVLIGSGSRVVALDLGEAEQTTIAVFDEPVRDLVVDSGGDVFVLLDSGSIERLGGGEVGVTGSDSRSLALTPDGGIFSLEAGGLFAVDASGGAEFLEESLPDSPGGLVVASSDGWPEGRRLSTIAWGSNIASLAIDNDGSLVWIDRVDQALFRAQAGADGRVEAGAVVSLLSRGEPIPTEAGRVMLAVEPSGRVVMSTRDQVLRYDVDSWQPLLTEPNISGIAIFADGVVVRTGGGLRLLDVEGLLDDITSLLPTDRLDPTSLYFSQSVAVVDGVVHVVQGGGVYRVVGWPAD
jgi:hypothetical protein